MAIEHAQAYRFPADVAGAPCLSGAERLADQHRGGVAERERDHEGECREVGGDLVRTGNDGSQACDEQRHEGEGGQVGDERQTDRDAELEEFLDGGEVRRGDAPAQLELGVFRVVQAPAPGERGHQPRIQRRCHRAAGRAHRREAEQAVHEQRVQRNLDASDSRLKNITGRGRLIPVDRPKNRRKAKAAGTPQADTAR